MYPAVGTHTSHAANYDTDRDGMADAWERKKGLNPNVNDANGKNLGGGYDNIEHFINELADSCKGGSTTVATTPVVTTPVVTTPAVTAPVVEKPTVVTPVVTTPKVTAPTSEEPDTPVTSGNLVKNSGFSNTSSWKLYGANAQNKTYIKSGSASIVASDKSKLRLLQAGLSLKSGTTYRLSFQARSSTTKGSVLVQMRKHSKVTTSVGIKNATVNVTNSLKTYTVDFKATGFSGTTTDTRLQFSFSRSPDATYTIDNVQLVEITSGAPTVVTPTVETPVVSTSTTSSNLVKNDNFSEKTGWNLYNADIHNQDFIQSGKAIIKVVSSVDKKTKKRVTPNLRLNQTRIPVQRNKKYRLTFQAKSSTSKGSVRVNFRKNSDLPQSLGISNANIAVTNETKTYTIDFKASGFRG